MRRFIIVVVMAVVAITVGTIVVGNRTFDGVVVDRPYEAGLAWDETQRRQERTGWRITVEQTAVLTGENRIVVRVTDPGGAPVEDAAVDVTISRPSTRNHDRTSRARALGQGRYEASVKLPLVGWWDVHTAVTRSADVVRASSRLIAGGQDR